MMGKLKIVRLLFVCSLVTLFALSNGCNSVRETSGGVDIKEATEVTFSELKKATAGEVSFRWWGSDVNFHYFETKKGFYRLETTFEMPHFDHLISQKAEPGERGVQACIDGETIAIWTQRRQLYGPALKK
jgi:hypothetical protein